MIDIDVMRCETSAYDMTSPLVVMFFWGEGKCLLEMRLI